MLRCSAGSLKARNVGMLQGIKCNAPSYFQQSTSMWTKYYLLDIKYLQIRLIIGKKKKKEIKSFNTSFSI